MSFFRVGLLTCVGLALGAARSGSARAQQFVAFDLAYEHSDQTSTYSRHWVAPPPGAPPNLVAPVDYSKGTIHYHLEVLTKASAESTMCHNCFGTAKHYICGPYSPKYTQPGTCEWSGKVAAGATYVRPRPPVLP